MLLVMTIKSNIPSSASAGAPTSTSSQAGNADELTFRRRSRLADRLLESNYESLKPAVIAAMRSRLFCCGLRFHRLDLEAFYNAAWEIAHRKIREGAGSEALAPFLVVVASYKAIDEARRTSPRLIAGGIDVSMCSIESVSAKALDLKITIRHVFEAMRETLGERELEAVRLCCVIGYSRPEAAELIGVTPDRMEKIMDGAQLKLRPQLRAIKEGRWCAIHKSRLRALAAGLLSPDGERYRAALAHLEMCPVCRADLRTLRGRHAA
jgi:DNA-directed RNA polymerase specialized sigma24 family protein